MKMKTWLPVVFFCGFLMSFGPSVQAQQQNIVKSDTISITIHDSLGFSLQDFGPISNGEKQCHTIYLKNTSSDIIVISSISTYSNGNTSNNFSAKAIPDFPLVMLQNEIVSLADLCYSPTNPFTTSVSGTLSIQYLNGSKNEYLSARVTGYQIIDTLLQKPCVTVTFDNKVFGPLIMDGDETHVVTLQSNRNKPIEGRIGWGELDSVHQIIGKYFTRSGITTSFVLAPLEKKSFNITFSPRSDVPKVQYRTTANFSMQFGAGCSSYDSVTLIGIAIPPTADSISTALNAGSSDILAMLGDNSVTTKTFHFKNTGSTNLKITSVSLKNNKSFSITDIQPTNSLPFTLAPSESMSVTISMTSGANGVYYDEVLITAENALISMNFPLQGLRTNSASVKAGQQQQYVTIYPNPSQGNIMVSMPGVSNAKITVTDLLGRVVTTATASESWNWNATVGAGTYFLQLDGVDAAGKQIKTNEQFIIQ